LPGSWRGFALTAYPLAGDKTAKRSKYADCFCEILSKAGPPFKS